MQHQSPRLMPALHTLLGMTLIFSVATSAYAESDKGRKQPKTKPSEVTYASDARVQQFAIDVALRRDLDPVQVRQVLAQARKLPQVQKLILPPTKVSAKNWTAYRARFIEPVRLKAGHSFWTDHRQWLEKAEAETGVPASLIVGVIGVETLYGRHMGTFRTLDALTTLAFDFPAAHPRAAARTEFFLGELEQFLSLTHRQGTDPLSYRSSYAGAMGMPQFMPSSWAKYAVDFDGDGKIDLFGSAADAIGSVAHYFKAFGWKPGLVTHVAVGLDATRLDLDALLAPDILPSFSTASFEAKGAVLGEPARQHPGPWALIELHNGDTTRGGQATSYVAGTDNFYTVTRYNWSSYYAMAVIELGQAVEQTLKGQPVSPTLAAPLR
ncbi:MAG TPA: lytic murein transglycosylase B [Burkholderiaceae bacterium]|nr:lytic murein transglycosylase B [Burkholderiaceae bacterium]